jgi:hypothetical protein
MVHQQVDCARSQFPMGRAAELASHLQHSHTPHLCGSHETARKARNAGVGPSRTATCRRNSITSVRTADFSTATAAY